MPNKSQVAWIQGNALCAKQAQRKWGVLASVTLAQAALESGFGASQLAKRANNLFGIKAMQGQDYVEFATTEFIRGRNVREMADFARYPSTIESFDAHGKLLATLKRYAPAMAVKNDPEKFCTELQLCGYSTNPQYAAELMKVIRDYNLTQYDPPPPDSPKDPAKAQEAA